MSRFDFGFRRNYFLAAIAFAMTFGIDLRSVAADPPVDLKTLNPQITVVDRNSIIEYRVLWDQECLLSYDFFGLKIKSEFGERIVYYYGQPDRVPQSGRPQLSAMAEIPFRNGKIHGKVRRWAEDGTLLAEVPYKDGLIDGECRFFSSTGKLLGTSTFQKGTGTYRVWDRAVESGKPIRETRYVGGTAIVE